jgi:hypothetical protein
MIKISIYRIDIQFNTYDVNHTLLVRYINVSLLNTLLNIEIFKKIHNYKNNLTRVKKQIFSENVWLMIFEPIIFRKYQSIFKISI